MELKLSRRGFGVLTASVALAALPGQSWAQIAGYANPQLLMEPEYLLGRVSATQSSRPKYEQDGIILIDIRPIDAFAAGHIPGALHLDPNAVVAGNSPVDGALKGLPELTGLLGATGVAADRRVVLYDDKGGFHAARMLWLLEYLGHRNVALLNGGWTAWDALAGEVSKNMRAYPAARFDAAASPRRQATADYILAQRDDANTIVIDVRPPELYQKGHIPWAINIPWSHNRTEDMRFKTAEQLQSHFEGFGVKHDRNIVLHCQTGLASAHSYVALRLLGYPRVRVYHRSWAEWGSDPSLPKAV
ncbi:MAG: sulfurtransferase [Pseudomonadota bacterium]